MNLIIDDWMDENIAINLAKDSVPRLKAAEAYDGELLNVLSNLIDDRLHPVNKILAEVSEMEWYGEEEQWEAYNQLLNEMIKILEK